MTTPVDASTYSDLTGLASLKREARTSDPHAIREVARQFESVFAKMMLSSMRQASMGDSLFDSEQTKFYQGMFDDQLALELTKGKGLGLADMLVQQLQRQGVVPKDGASDAADPAKSGTSEAATSGPHSASNPARAVQSRSDVNRGASFLPLGAQAAASGRSAPSAAPATPGAFVGDADVNRANAAYRSRGIGAAPATASAGDASVTGAISHDTASGTSTPNGGTAASNSAPTAGGGPGAKSSRTLTPDEFVQQLWPCAEAAGKELGVDPAHLLAQAALETGWGKSLPCDANGNTSFNFFGIKAGDSWSGDSVSVKTLEVENGVAVPRQAKFRSYASAEDSFKDYVSVLKDNPRYASALNTGSNAKAFAAALQKGGYATDPAYAQKIAAIAQNLASATGLKSSGSQPTTSPQGPL